jgi:hypothetical protein
LGCKLAARPIRVQQRVLVKHREDQVAEQQQGSVSSSSSGGSGTKQAGPGIGYFSAQQQQAWGHGEMDLPLSPGSHNMGLDAACNQQLPVLAAVGSLGQRPSLPCSNKAVVAPSDALGRRMGVGQIQPSHPAAAIAVADGEGAVWQQQRQLRCCSSDSCVQGNHV